jgi:hypothetical protein
MSNRGDKEEERSDGYAREQKIPPLPPRQDDGQDRRDRYQGKQRSEIRGDRQRQAHGRSDQKAPAPTVRAGQEHHDAIDAIHHEGERESIAASRYEQVEHQRIGRGQNRREQQEPAIAEGQEREPEDRKEIPGAGQQDGKPHSQLGESE